MACYRVCHTLSANRVDSGAGDRAVNDERMCAAAVVPKDAGGWEVLRFEWPWPPLATPAGHKAMGEEVANLHP